MNSLAGQLLVAMPQMSDPRFVRSVIYLCAHGGETGAMGLVINKLLGSLTMGELFAQLEIEPSGHAGGHPGHFGGQLDAEIQANGWLSVAADSDIVFSGDDDAKWGRALAKLGVDLTMLSSDAGHA